VRLLSTVVGLSRFPGVRQRAYAAQFPGPHTDCDPGLSPGTLERLRTVKRNRDPHGVFRGNYPVLGWGLIRATS